MATHHQMTGPDCSGDGGLECPVYLGLVKRATLGADGCLPEQVQGFRLILKFTLILADVGVGNRARVPRELLTDVFQTK